VFEVFTRRLPPGRRFGVVAGQGRLSALLPEVRYDDEALRGLDFLGDQARAWLRDRPLARGHSYPEGEVFVPGSPVATVSGCFGRGAAARDARAVGAQPRQRRRLRRGPHGARRRGRPCSRWAGRRTHEQAAVAAARAAYVAGFAQTSNLEAGRRHAVPTAGTSAHAFTLAHPSEVEAFRSQVATLGAGTTLLVDTYDTVQGIRNAVEVAGTGLGAVRLDSGDPQVEVPRARALLDELGATSTRIVVTGDLDEHTIAELVPTAADAFGSGRRS
jgi:nicotinate phosphoribosyltransferase